VLLTIGTVALQSAGRVAVDGLPTSVDKRMGELAYENMSMQGRTLDDERVNAAVKAIVDRLNRGTADEFTYRVYVHDAPITNAFALPGGVLVVYTGLLRDAESAEQVAGVLAHEIAHVQRRHGMRRIAQSLGVVAALQLLVGDVSGVAAVAVHVLREATVNNYSRQQEREADLDAVKLMANAGIDPRALAGFFEVLQRKESGPSLPVWLATHPDLAERVTDIRQVAASTPVRDPRPLELDWPDIQKRVRATEGAKDAKDKAAAPAAGGGARPFVVARPH
jgi:beta-barrel assembly-enhancing protease